MPISYNQAVDLQCPSCDQPFSVTVWMLIDAQERPDLAEAVRQGTIHDITCPNCGQPGTAPAPLLYHDRDRRRVLFAAPPDMSEEEWRREAEGLLWMLIGALPEQQRLPYLGEVQAEAGASGLAFVLQQESSADRPAETAVEALSDSLVAADEEIPVLAEAVIALLEAQTPAEIERVFDRYPFLLDQAMDEALQQLATAAAEQGDAQTAEAFQRSAALLAQLRQMLPQASVQAEEDRQETAPDAQSPPEADEPVPPAGWSAVLRALLDPDQPADLEELQRRYPLLSDPNAPTWLRAELTRRRDVGNLAEVQLLNEWLRQMKEG